MNDLVSIIVPCYNGEKFVDRCFNSILKQDYARIQIIAVNDGSTDQSEQRILAWNDRFKNAGMQLVYIAQENKGPGGAINTGLKAVSGEFLSLLDVDDEFLESAISSRVAFLNEHKDIDVVRSNGWYNRKSGKNLFMYDDAEKKIGDVFSALIVGKTNNWAGSYMVRTSALFAFYPDREIYQSRYGQNLQLLLPLTYQKKCGFIDEPQMKYNIQANSLSQTSDQQECMARTLRNGKGYLDIRLHLIEQVIRDPEERQKYVQIANVAYHRFVLNRAVSLRDKVVTREAYGNLKRDHALTISDTIEYCAMFCPCVVFPLRCIRKLTRVLKRENAGRRRDHEHHTNS